VDGLIVHCGGETPHFAVVLAVVDPESVSSVKIGVKPLPKFAHCLLTIFTTRNTTTSPQKTIC